MPSQPPTAAQWEQHRELLLDLYVNRKLSRKDVRAYMLENHGFNATVTMYDKHFAKWYGQRYTRPRDAQAAVEAIVRRHDAGKVVVGIRLHGRSLTLQQVHESLRRSRRKPHTTTGLMQAPLTPPYIAVDCEDDVRPEDSPEIEMSVVDILSDEAVRRRMRTPDLVGAERLEVFLIGKLNHWRDGYPINELRNLDRILDYFVDLSRLLSINAEASNPRTLWTLRKLEPIVNAAFRTHSLDLLQTLCHFACRFDQRFPAWAKWASHIRSTILFAARKAVEGRDHPLLVSCTVLFGDEQRLLSQRILQHLATFTAQTYGERSFEWSNVVSARSTYLRGRNRLKAASSVLTDLVGSLSVGSPAQRDMARALSGDLAYLLIEGDDFEKAHELLDEVIEYCQQASRDQKLPITELSSVLRGAYSAALESMWHLHFKRGDFVAAEQWALRSLAYCGQAHGTSDARTLYAVDRVEFCLEMQEKWAEVDQLWRQWKPLVEPPGFFEVDEMETFDEVRHESDHEVKSDFDDEDVAMHEPFSDVSDTDGEQSTSQEMADLQLPINGTEGDMTTLESCAATYWTPGV